MPPKLLSPLDTFIVPYSVRFVKRFFDFFGCFACGEPMPYRVHPTASHRPSPSNWLSQPLDTFIIADRVAFVKTFFNFFSLEPTSFVGVMNYVSLSVLL